MKLNERKLVTTLRKHGYKLTSQRIAVIKAIASSNDHLTPADIYTKVCRENPDIGLVTVYRTLEILDKLDLICEVHSGGSCRSYLVRRPVEHHHHLICSDCGKVVDFTNCDLSKVTQSLSEKTGFKIESHLLEFLGICQACQKAQKLNS
jgi:Fur family ferric uptake transcriptional regulator